MTSSRKESSGRLEIVFIDSEPPDVGGGGIRTYMRLALQACRDAGVAAMVYSHNPLAYPGERSLPIGRKPLPAPLRGLAYRICYRENIHWEHARWLGAELAAGDAPCRVYEFCDYQGYAFFALRNPILKARVLVRVHTPHFLIAPVTGKNPAQWPARLAAWREKDCLIRARHLTVPSAEFVRGKLPWLGNWTYVPNPVPPLSADPASLLAKTQASLPDSVPVSFPDFPPLPGADPGSDWVAAPDKIPESAERPPAVRIMPDRFLYLGRVEERKGILVAIRAFLRLAPEMPYASLTLVGAAAPGPYAEQVRALVDSQPPLMRLRLVWEPPCPAEARPALFRRFTCLIVPSLWENSPYTYFEGMASGLHCIGSDCGEMRAAAQATGGLLARPGDEEDWLRIMRAHCLGAGRDALAAQASFLSGRRKEIPGLMFSAYRRAAGAAEAGGDRTIPSPA